MPGLKFNQFAGMAPRVNDRARSAQIADLALDVNLDEGTLRPWRQPLEVHESGFDKVLAMILVDCCWLTTDKCVSFCVPWPSCPFVVKAGDGVPVYATFADACIGDWCPLTWPCPDVAPTPSPTRSAPSVEERGYETRAYRYAWVNRYGHETGGSPPSFPINANDGDAIVVQIPPAPDGYCIEGVRLYRTGTPFETGAEKSNPMNTEWFLVGEFDAGIGVVTDNIPSRDLSAGQSAPATFLGDERLPAPDDLIEVVTLENGQMAGISPSLRMVVMSEPFLPTSWPVRYRKMLWDDEYPIALASIGSVLYVGTNGRPYTINAVQQESNADGRHGVFRFREPSPCLSPRSMCAGAGAVYFASLDGLVALSGTQQRVISEELWSKDQWRSLHPSRMIGAVHDGHYLGFSDNAGFRLRTAEQEHTDQRTAMLTYLSDRPDAIWLSDHGSLYMAKANIVSQWNAGNVLRPYRWRCTEFQWARRTSLTAYYAQFENLGPVDVTVSTEKGAFTHSPLNSDINRLPNWMSVTETQITLAGTGEVSEFAIGTSIKETFRAGAQV
jgi:hypothetical protein